MSYTPTTWVDGTTKLGPTNLNKLENGVQAAAVVADAAVPSPASIASGEVPVWNGSSWVRSSATKIASGMFAGILNADVGAGAAIVGSKLATGLSGPPGQKLTYNEFTSNVSVTATTEGTANTVVTASAFSFDGATEVLISFFATDTIPGTTALSLWLYDGSSSIGNLGFRNVAAATAPHQWVSLYRYLTPSNASHTYSIRASVDGGTGQVSAGAGGVGVAFPGYIRITKA